MQGDEAKVVNDLRREELRQEIAELRKQQSAALDGSRLREMCPLESKDCEDRKILIAMLEARLEAKRRPPSFGGSRSC